ncbi:MAG: hypothetical protein GF353_02745 [Candidatus Lokiarchaeota archaeon]|nr:hypothetical protein [Candidatus Lokiarchaeota archaeon]
MFNNIHIVLLIILLLFAKCDQKLDIITKKKYEFQVPNDTTIAFIMGTKQLGLHIGITYNHKSAYSLTDGPFETHVDWSPNKKWIIYTKNIDQIEQIWKMDYDGNNKKKISPDHLSCEMPFISPDGSKIVASCLIDKTDHLIILDTTSSKDWKQVTDSTLMNYYNIGRFFNPYWSPDCKNLIFNYNLNDWSNMGLGIFNINTRRISFLKELDNLSPFFARWSPTRDEIIFVGNAIPGIQIYRANLDGANPVKLTNAFMASFPDWSPDGDRIAYLRWESLYKNPTIWIMNRDGSNKKKALDISNKLCASPNW